MRHNYLHDLVYYALLQVGLPLNKEPTGLFRTDGKRPDGLTNVPGQAEKLDVWDIIVADTFADAYLALTSMAAAAAEKLAATKKKSRMMNFQRHTTLSLKPSSL